MPLVRVTSQANEPILGRVVGVWDDGDHRTVQVMPGVAGGVEVGMFVQIVKHVDGAPPVPVGDPAVITSVKERVAIFTTPMAFESIVADVVISHRSQR